MKRPPPRSENGFTLIELLVVVAIIAILAGILLPALGKAKASARKVKCIAQIREVSVAVNQFAYDHENRYPGATDVSVSLDYADLGGEGNNGHWSSINKAVDRPLFQYIETLDLFECPGDRGNDNPLTANVFEDSGSSYFYALDDSRTTGMGIEIVEDQKLTSFSALSKKVLLFEPTLFANSDKDDSKTKWHTDVKASVLGFGDGHAALVEEDNPPYRAIPSDADERAQRDFY